MVEFHYACVNGALGKHSIIFDRSDDALDADSKGQTNVGGAHAWVMLQAFELTNDKRFLDDTRAAVDEAMGRRFWTGNNDVGSRGLRTSR